MPGAHGALAEITRQSVADTYRTLGPGLDQRLRESGYRSLTALLEAEDPTEARDLVAGVDAFTRILNEADIITYNNPDGGYMCSDMGVWARSENRFLFGEWCRRHWLNGSTEKKRRRFHPHYVERPGQDAERLAGAAGDTPETRRLNALNAAGMRAAALFMTNDFLEGSIQRPYDDDPALRFQDLQPAVPLVEVLSRTRPVDGITFRARYLVTPTAAQVRMIRVAEGAELPKATITEAQRTFRLLKFGRSIGATYEALRRLPLEDFATWVRYLRLQTEVDQVGAAIDVMINGDGNPNTSAVVYNLTTLDPATSANTLTVLAWLAFRMKWVNPYALTTILAREAEMIKVLNLNVGTANLLLVSGDTPVPFQQNFTPIQDRLAGGIRYGITTDAPAARVLGFDNRFAITRLFEPGSEISESERFITNQSEVLTFSMTEGYMVEDPNATAVKIIALDA